MKILDEFLKGPWRKFSWYQKSVKGFICSYFSAFLSVGEKTWYPCSIRQYEAPRWDYLVRRNFLWLLIRDKKAQVDRDRKGSKIESRNLTANR